MPTITEIYRQYPITKNLQEHQLRVAAVGTLIARHMTEPVDADGITRVCLIHDMGNLLKFDLGQTPEWLEPEGAGYWKTRQAEMSARYGHDEHAATKKIARELGV